MRAFASSSDPVEIHVDGTTVTFAGADLSPSADAALSMALLPALWTAEDDLAIEGAVDGGLLRSATALQDIFGRWSGRSHRVSVSSTVESGSVASGARTAVFFSGGVDSMFALKQHLDEIDELVYVVGFDVHSGLPVLEELLDRLRGVASDVGKVLTVVETDLRQWSNPRVGWGLYHGSALATVAHLLAGREIGRVIVPSSYAYDELFPWGSHPLTDPLWSGQVRIEHRGSEATRFEKIEALQDFGPAQHALRVCLKDMSGSYNCGRCEKCVRTMLALEGLGALQRFPVFPPAVRPSTVLRTPIVSTSARAFGRDNLKELRDRGASPALTTALRVRLMSRGWRYNAGRVKRAVSRK